MSKDLFSKQAKDYAKYRPVYPKELFDHIFQFVEEKNIAWDCATGNGQAALALAQRFKKVIATDISEKQLSLAKPHPIFSIKFLLLSKQIFLIIYSILLPLHRHIIGLNFMRLKKK